MKYCGNGVVLFLVLCSLFCKHIFVGFVSQTRVLLQHEVSYHFF
jgi:hypothetical protein